MGPNAELAQSLDPNAELAQSLQRPGDAFYVPPQWFH
jgi:hypothetical protein